MKLLPDWLRNGYLRGVRPLAAFLAERDVSPNLITVCGTLFYVAGGCLYATGRMHAAGWLLGVTAFFDVLDGEVARRSGRSTVFGAFLDSTLDRIADAAVLGGLAFFFATDRNLAAPAPLILCLLALVGTFMVSYTRAKAEAVGVAVTEGFMQRPERVVLLSAPQAFFGLALNGAVVVAVVLFLAATSWYTVAQRIAAVHRLTGGSSRARTAAAQLPAEEGGRAAGRPLGRGGR